MKQLAYRHDQGTAKDADEATKKIEEDHQNRRRKCRRRECGRSRS